MDAANVWFSMVILRTRLKASAQGGSHTPAWILFIHKKPNRVPPEGEMRCSSQAPSHRLAAVWLVDAPWHPVPVPHPQPRIFLCRRLTQSRTPPPPPHRCLPATSTLSFPLCSTAAPVCITMFERLRFYRTSQRLMLGIVRTSGAPVHMMTRYRRSTAASITT